LDRFSNWLMRRWSRLAFLCIMFRSFTHFSSSVVEISFSRGPRIRVSGVRNSCDILAKKRDFMPSSSFSFSASTCSISSACFRRWRLRSYHLHAMIKAMIANPYREYAHHVFQGGGEIEILIDVSPPFQKHPLIVFLTRKV